MSFIKHSLCAALLIAAAPAWSAPCAVEIDGNDQMKFDKQSIDVPKECKTFAVTLKHSGKLPANVMGHNWVLTKAEDMQGVASDGIPAGVPNNYLKAGDSRVIAATKLIGGGQSDTVTFNTDALQAGQNYAFFCSFPGHWAIMKGTLALAK